MPAVDSFSTLMAQRFEEIAKTAAVEGIAPRLTAFEVKVATLCFGAPVEVESGSSVRLVRFEQAPTPLDDVVFLAANPA